MKKFGICILYISTLATATPVHSTLRSYTGTECGVKSYVQSTRESCGVDHFVSKQSPLCPAVRFNLRTDASCPGSDAGGRVVIGSVFDSGKVAWRDDNYVQGSENIAQMVSSINYNKNETFPKWSQNTQFWSCSASMSGSGGGRTPRSFSGTITCVTKPVVTTCEKPEFGIAVEGTCALAEFGKIYRTCEDTSLVQEYKTCELRKTADEINAYIEATRPNIEVLAQQLATAQGNYILGSKQTKLASCLIARYESDILYEDITQDLKNTYSAMFGLDYQSGQFDCADIKETVEYTYQGKSCKNVSAAEISAKLSIPTLALNERYFYELCQQKMTVDSLTDWFNFQIEETDLLLSDLIARSNTDVAARLTSFKSGLKNVKSEDIKCQGCRVTTLETSKPTPPPTPPPLSETLSEMIYDGESHPFSAGQGWDISMSTVEDSTIAPASGLHHIRATLNNQNYWGAAAYAVDNWAAKDFSGFKKIRFKAKANKSTRVKLFFVSMDNNLESQHLEFNVTTAWQSFEFDLSAAVTDEYNLSQVQGIVIAVSQPGKATYLVDLDDVELQGQR